jgi:hypothetical protein
LDLPFKKTVQFQSDGTGFSGTDHAAVQLTDRQDLPGSIAKKSFVRVEKFVPCQRNFLDPEFKFEGAFYHKPAGHSIQD